MTVYELMQNNFDFGLNDYEIFDENYRTILNSTILEYYKFREIGFSNPIMWRDRLKARMNLIMRNKYNELYKNKLVEFNPLYNIDITETFEHDINNTQNATSSGTNTETGSDNSENSSNSSNNANARNLHSQYPSEELQEGDLSSNLYVDSANHQVEENNSTNTSNNSSEYNKSNHAEGETQQTGKTKESYTKVTKGSSAGLPFSRAMLQFKDFVSKYDLDLQVIKELSDLFITLY